MSNEEFLKTKIQQCKQIMKNEDNFEDVIRYFRETHSWPPFHVFRIMRGRNSRGAFSLVSFQFKRNAIFSGFQVFLSPIYPDLYFKHHICNCSI